MLLKDRVMLITNVEKFAGHGTTRVALGQGATVLAHDPSFEAPSARRKYETAVPGRACAGGDRARDPGRAGAEASRPHRRAGQQRRLSRAARAARRSAAGGLPRRARGHGGGAVPARPARGAVDAQAQVGPHRVRVVGGAVARHRQLRALRRRRARRANGLVASLAKELGRDGITVNAVGSNYVENPDYFPPALLANQEAMAKMTAQIPLGRLGKSDELGRRDLLPLFRRRRASSPAMFFRMPADGRDARTGACHYLSHNAKAAHGRTEARLPGSDVQTRRQRRRACPWSIRSEDGAWEDRSSIACWSRSRLARGSLPLLLSAAGRAGRSGDDHRRPRRQGRDHRRHPPRARPRPADPDPVRRIHRPRAARRSRPLDHLQQDGERGAGAHHRSDRRADAGRHADRGAARPGAGHAGGGQARHACSTG